MNNLERKQYIENICQKKGLNLETQNYILQYISLNETLFGDFLNIDTVTQNVLNNLNSSINRNNTRKFSPLFFPFMKIFLNFQGCFNVEDKSIYINPTFKFLAKFYKKINESITSIAMHELDHCATTRYNPVSLEEKNEFINQIKGKYNNSNKFLLYLAICKLNNIYKNTDGAFAVSGIDCPTAAFLSGLNLKSLNEGITAYKQELYDKQLGISHNTGYKDEKKLAIFISDIIGKDNLIQMHFDNDYQGIRQLFNEKTKMDLNDFVKKINKKPKPSHLLKRLPILNIIHRKKYRNKYLAFSKDFDQSIELAKKNFNNNGEESFTTKLKFTENSKANNVSKESNKKTTRNSQSSQDILR